MTQEHRLQDLNHRARYLGIDPGKNIGLAWVNDQGKLLHSAIMDLDQITTLASVTDSSERQSLENLNILVGNGTGLSKLEHIFKAQQLSYQIVDESGTSLEARQLYFKDHPASGWQRLLPPGLRSPSRSVDDYAAYAIVLRHLKSR